MSAPVVIVREPGRTPLHIILRDPLEVGRDCAGLLLDDLQVSRRHLELRPVGGQVEVRDLGSTNGTLVDGEPLAGPGTLTAATIVRLGDTTIQLAPDPAIALPDDASIPSRSSQTSIELVADQVTADRSRIVTEASAEADRGTVTIVFSDIESSTKRAVELGDARWFDVLSRHNLVVREQVRQHHGSEVKAQGDGFMLTFPSARRALHCMVGAQRRLTESFADAVEDESIRVRVGVHTGEVIVGDDGDIFGRHVNIAARVANEARGGEILVSSLVREIVETRGDLSFGEPRPVELKGLPGTHLVHPLLWDR